MSTYAKTAPGETLTYRPDNLSDYDGEQFCLRITLDDYDLDRCFFVYIDERFEDYSLRKLFVTYFIAPGPEQEAELSSWLDPWLGLDPMLPKKLMLLRQMFRRVDAEGKPASVAFHINHGPAHVDLEDTVRSHLGTSVFDDGSFNDKILDVVLEFRSGDWPMPEVDQWWEFPPIDTTGGGSGAVAGTGLGEDVNRRNVLGLFAFVAAMIGLPFLFGSCQNRGGNGGGGFVGGAL